VLERFRRAKAAELAALEKLAAGRGMPAPFAGPRPSFSAALRAKAPPGIIAEYKRASPSRGDINLALSPERAAEIYAAAGAGALSVLTEETYFKGDMEYLRRMSGPGLPLLRKDFILHPLQVERTAASPASALLLIVRMLDTPLLRDLVDGSRNFGLEAVAEVFDERDLSRAREAGASLIQVNNRDLDTLRVDCSLSRRLAAFKREGEFWISASGIDSAEKLESLRSFGFDAALVGGFLMRDADPGRALAALLRGKDCGA
jgi:indole-3-glycerol phosphate synthase